MNSPIRACTQSELETFPQLDWSDITSRMQTEARVAIERVLETQNGAVLSRAECLLLANAEGDDLLGLLVAADLLRCELAGNLVPYVLNPNINFTTSSFFECNICTFRPA